METYEHFIFVAYTKQCSQKLVLNVDKLEKFQVMEILIFKYLRLCVCNIFIIIMRYDLFRLHVSST